MNFRNTINKSIVLKPWGKEYVIYSDGEKLAITLLEIKPGMQTSLHCHSKKKTGFIILKGVAKIQVGIYKKNNFIYKSGSRLVFREGLFHKISNFSKKNLYVLEIEKPFIKKDLIRLQDKNGRSNTQYEGKSFFKPIGKDYVVFKKPKKSYNKYIVYGKTLFINKIYSSRDIIVKKKKFFHCNFKWTNY